LPRLRSPSPSFAPSLLFAVIWILHWEGLTWPAASPNQCNPEKYGVDRRATATCQAVKHLQGPSQASAATETSSHDAVRMRHQRADSPCMTATRDYQWLAADQWEDPLKRPLRLSQTGWVPHDPRRVAWSFAFQEGCCTVLYRACRMLRGNKLQPAQPRAARC
jgi:hypothetical protein